jgi:outer membrane protein
MKNLAILIFSFLIFHSAIGQIDNSPNKRVWTLEACILEAWNNSLAVTSTEYAKEFADINLTQSKHARYPSLNGGSSMFFNFGRSIDPTTNEFVTTTFISNNWSLNTGMTLFNAGRINNTIKQSRTDVKASELDLEQTKNDIALQVSTAFLNVLFSIENLKNANLQLELSQEQLEQTQQLIDIGTRPVNERLDIEAQIATRQQTVIVNQNAVDNAYLLLKQLMRLDPDYVMELDAPDSIDLFSNPDILTYDEVYRTAIKTQKNIAAAEMRVKSAELGVKIANSGKYPNIGLGGSLGTNYSNQFRRIIGFNTIRQSQEVFFNGQSATIGTDVEVPVFENNPYFNQLDQNLSYGFGVNMNIPIYNNYNISANVQRAKLNILNSQNTLQQTQDLVRNNVTTALANARAAKLAYEASLKSVDAQNASFENAKQRYELGSINSFELTSIQNQLETAQVNLLVSKYDFFFKMKVLDFYMGQPMRLQN